jgi:hypothetical protein
MVVKIIKSFEIENINVKDVVSFDITFPWMKNNNYLDHLG